MGPFEYLLLFTAVILGLAVSDLALSLHRLLGAGARVTWDWLAPMAAVVAFLKIVTQWWIWYGAKALADGMTWEMFLALLVSTLLLFLLAAAALPDETDAPIDLAAHYAAISRRYWILFIGQWLLGNAFSIWAQMAIGHAHFDPRTLISPGVAIAAVAVVLVFVRNRWLHGLSLVGLIALYLVQSFGRSLVG